MRHAGRPTTLGPSQMRENKRNMLDPDCVETLIKPGRPALVSCHVTLSIPIANLPKIESSGYGRKRHTITQKGLKWQTDSGLKAKRKEIFQLEDSTPTPKKDATGSEIHGQPYIFETPRLEILMP